MGIVEFLNARISEDESLARTAMIDDSTGGNWVIEDGSPDSWIKGLSISAMDSNWDACISTNHAAHVVRWNPARVLAECAAKRAIVAMYPADCGGVTIGEWESCSDDCADRVADSTARVLAAVYADHPDYDEKWKP